MCSKHSLFLHNRAKYNNITSYLRNLLNIQIISRVDLCRSDLRRFCGCLFGSNKKPTSWSPAKLSEIRFIVLKFWNWKISFLTPFICVFCKLLLVFYCFVLILICVHWCLGAGACGAGRLPAAEGPRGWEAAGAGESATSWKRHQQSYQQHADGQQQVGAEGTGSLWWWRVGVWIYVTDELLVLANSSIFISISPGRKRAPRFSKPWRKIGEWHNIQIRFVTAKTLQHMATLIWLFSTYQTEPIYRTRSNQDALSAFRGRENKNTTGHRRLYLNFSVWTL